MSSVPSIDNTFDNASIRIDELSLYIYSQMSKKYRFFFLLTRNLISYHTIIRITYILCNIKGSSLLLIVKTCIDNLSTKLATYGTQYVSTIFIIATNAITFGSLSRRIRCKIEKEKKFIRSSSHGVCKVNLWRRESDQIFLIASSNTRQ